MVSVDDNAQLRLILDQLKELKGEVKCLHDGLNELAIGQARLEERIVGKKTFATLERRVDALEQTEARRKGVLAGLSVAGGGAVAGVLEAIRRIFE